MNFATLENCALSATPTNSSAFEKIIAGASITPFGKVVKIGGKLYKVGSKGSDDATYFAKGTGKNNPLSDVQYTDKVKSQMAKGDYHSFPKSVDSFGSSGKTTKITGGDGIVRTKVEVPGSYNGKKGIFEYIIEPDGVTVNHRLFIPSK